MFIVDSRNNLDEEFSTINLFDEAAYNSFLVNDMDHINFIMEELSNKDSKFRKERDEIHREVEAINETLDEKTDISKLKRNWNRILAVFSSAMLLAGGAAGMYAANKAATKKGWSSKERLAGAIPIGLIVAAMVKIVHKFLSKRAQKKDINIVKNDIEKVKKKLNEAIAKHEINKKMCETNIERLNYLLQRMDQSSTSSDFSNPNESSSEEE